MKVKACVSCHLFIRSVVTAELTHRQALHISLQFLSGNMYRGIRNKVKSGLRKLQAAELPLSVRPKVGEGSAGSGALRGRTAWLLITLYPASLSEHLSDERGTLCEYPI